MYWKVPLNRHLLWGSLVFLTISMAQNLQLKADTFGPEFKPGPHAADISIPKPGMSFAGMNLSGSIFIALDLSDCDFSECNLKKTVFLSCILANASFQNADLSHACIFADDEGIFLHDEYYNSSKTIDLTNTTIDGLHCYDCCISWSQLCTTRNYKTKNLNGFFFSGVEFSDDSQLDFSGFDLNGANLAGVNYRSPSSLVSSFWDTVILTDANINDAVFCMPFDTREFIHHVNYGINVSYCKITKKTGLTFEQFKTTKHYKEGDLRFFYFAGNDLS